MTSETGTSPLHPIASAHHGLALLLLILLLCLPQPAQADEIFIGIAAHEVDTPLSFKTWEEGLDFQAGYRGDRIEGLTVVGAPSPYMFASVNSAGDTSFFAAGLSWKIGKKVYLRPGFGLAVHTGPKLRFAPDGSQTQLGSRILFEPELAVGVRLSDRVDLEASWTHLSHAQLFSKQQNPGLDVIGARLVVKLP